MYLPTIPSLWTVQLLFSINVRRSPFQITGNYLGETLLGNCKIQLNRNLSHTQKTETFVNRLESTGSKALFKIRMKNFCIYQSLHYFTVDQSWVTCYYWTLFLSVCLTMFSSFCNCWFKLTNSCSLASNAAIFSSLQASVVFRIHSVWLSKILYFLEDIKHSMLVIDNIQKDKAHVLQILAQCLRFALYQYFIFSSGKNNKYNQWTMYRIASIRLGVKLVPCKGA